MEKLMASRRQRYKFSKLLMFPLIDCVFLVLFFFIFVAMSESFTPTRAIPLYNFVPGSPGLNYRDRKVFVKIDNPIDDDVVGRMHLQARFPKTATYRDIQYDEMLSHIQNIPNEHKKMLLIRSDRDMHHQQIIRVMEIGNAAGIDKVGYWW